ncbi:MAG: hypothetical protein HY296_07480 [Thaumarchaeota archaeon]|nr:hypothetical protein [Nitrososphaerota archaeon]
MAEARLDVREIIESRERDFLFSKVRVRMRTDVENIDAGDYSIGEAHEGESLEVPRWMAEELVALNLADSPDKPLDLEVSWALSREKMMGPLQLSVLPPDFYVRMRRTVARLSEGVKAGTAKKEEFMKFKSACYDLVGMRVGKVLSLSSASTSARDLGDNIAPEEKSFFTVAQALSKEWRAALLGEPK